jgi:hypothetical protein
MLAATEKHLFAGWGRVFHWREFRPLVRPVTKRLLGRLSASAPKVGFAFLYLNRIGGGLRDFRGFGHGGVPYEGQLVNKLSVTPASANIAFDTSKLLLKKSSFPFG